MGMVEVGRKEFSVMGRRESITPVLSSLLMPQQGLCHRFCSLLPSLLALPQFAFLMLRDSLVWDCLVM